MEYFFLICVLLLTIALVFAINSLNTETKKAKSNENVETKKIFKCNNCGTLCESNDEYCKKCVHIFVNNNKINAQEQTKLENHEEQIEGAINSKQVIIKRNDNITLKDSQDKNKIISSTVDDKTLNDLIVYKPDAFYNYIDNNNQHIKLTKEKVNELMKSNKNLISLSIAMNSTVDEARKLVFNMHEKNLFLNYSSNQYNKWTEEEDNQLEKEYKNNLSIKEISQIHGRSTGAILSRLKHKNLYISDTDVKTITTLNKEEKSGVFRIRFEEENTDEVYFYNIKEKEDNIKMSQPLFKELFITEIGEKNDKFHFIMLDKSQYVPEKKIEEKITIDKNKLYELKIYNLTNYIPKWCNRIDENSKRILDLKNRHIYAIQYYSKITYDWLKEHNYLNNDTILAVIPSHEASNDNISGTADIAKNILQNSNMVNGVNLILRKHTIYKKSTSMYRPTLNMDINSLELNKKIDFKNKTIIILDDVTTHGDSFRAAAYHLYKAGANIIIPLAIGKTVIPNE